MFSERTGSPVVAVETSLDLVDQTHAYVAVFPSAPLSDNNRSFLGGSSLIEEL